MNSRSPIRVLVIEDSATDAELIAAYLEQVRTANYEISLADTLGESLKRLQEQSYDVVLVDLSLSDSHGMSTCTSVLGHCPSTPVIVLTGLNDEAVALDAMKIGVQDYLVKDEMNGGLLSRSIRYSIERHRAKEQQFQSQERMRLLTEQMPAILWTTDARLRITEPSTHLLVSDEEARAEPGTLLADFTRGSDLDSVLEAHEAAVRGESVSTEFRWRGRSLSMHVEPLCNGTGQIIGTIGISVDVSTQKRMQLELNAARQVQQALFPNASPKVAGFDIAGAVYPAEETAGDYFDFIPMADDCVGLVVGDVTGHGLGPALLMAELRAYLRALASTRPHSGEILMLANRFLIGDLEEHRFVTLFLARLDPATRSITYAAAGHVAYVLRADGAIETLPGTGLPLGLIPDTIINTSFPVTLSPGDVLFIPTDGIQESHTRSNELFGLDRMLSFVRKHRDEPAADIIEGLRAEVCRFIGSTSVPDDMSAIIVRCLTSQS